MNIELCTIEGKKICTGGIGKLFFQEGMPIGISANKLKENGITLSWLHVADECLKHGWSAKTTFKKIREDIKDSGEELFDISLFESFCFADYNSQRDMIFKSLFRNNDVALEFGKSIIRN